MPRAHGLLLARNAGEFVRQSTVEFFCFEKRITRIVSNLQQRFNDMRQEKCYVVGMMGFGSYGTMGGAGLFGAITWIVIIVDLIFVGIWLWQKISKK